MGTMTDETVAEPEGRRYLRNTTGEALAVHPSVRPVPDIVEAGELVEVDTWGLDSLEASGFEHVGIRKAEAEHKAQMAKLLAPPDPTPVPLAVQEQADNDEATADAGTADDQEG
jgi:hypothetical protein